VPFRRQLKTIKSKPSLFVHTTITSHSLTENDQKANKHPPGKPSHPRSYLTHPPSNEPSKSSAGATQALTQTTPLPHHSNYTILFPLYTTQTHTHPNRHHPSASPSYYNSQIHSQPPVQVPGTYTPPPLDQCAFKNPSTRYSFPTRLSTRHTVQIKQEIGH
jgi:hypothetical protein